MSYVGPYELWRDYPDTQYGKVEQILCELNYYDEVICFIDRMEAKKPMEKKFLKLFQGDDKTYNCYVKDKDLNPINLTGATCTMTWKTSKSSGTTILQKSTDDATEAQIGVAADGQVYFYIVPADTSSLSVRQYVFDIKVEVSSKTYTVCEGYISLEQTVS